MKIGKFFLLLIPLFLLSCWINCKRKVTYLTILVNNTNKEIKCNIYKKQVITDSFILKTNESKTFIESYPSNKITDSDSLIFDMGSNRIIRLYNSVGKLPNVIYSDSTKSIYNGNSLQRKITEPTKCSGLVESYYYLNQLNE